MFWLFMLFVTLIIPCSMYMVGKKYLVSPPPNINSSKGFRTKLSTRSQATWDFAQHLCGILWKSSSPWLAGTSIAAMLLVLGEDDNCINTCGIIIVVIQIIFLFILGAVINIALKRNFKKDGSPLQK